MTNPSILLYPSNVQEWSVVNAPWCVSEPDFHVENGRSVHANVVNSKEGVAFRAFSGIPPSAHFLFFGSRGLKKYFLKNTNLSVIPRYRGSAPLARNSRLHW